MKKCLCGLQHASTAQRIGFTTTVAHKTPSRELVLSRADSKICPLGKCCLVQPYSNKPRYGTRTHTMRFIAWTYDAGYCRRDMITYGQHSLEPHQNDHPVCNACSPPGTSPDCCCSAATASSDTFDFRSAIAMRVVSVLAACRRGIAGSGSGLVTRSRFTPNLLLSAPEVTFN